MFCSVLTQAQTFKITRNEQKSDALFVCINSLTKPVYIEHFLTADERKDSKEITKTIERLVAELQVKEDKYVEPEKFISKMADAEKIKVDTAKISIYKLELIAKEKAIADSLIKK